MTDFALFHIRTHKAGEHGYHQPRARGTVDVWHDSTRYVYGRFGVKPSARDFRRFIVDAWRVYEGKKLSGRWPSYTVE